MESRWKEIELKEKKRLNRYFQAMSLFFTLQFGISGYTIYGVSWLGWDLVEPLTYTIS